MVIGLGRAIGAPLAPSAAARSFPPELTIDGNGLSLRDRPVAPLHGGSCALPPTGVTHPELARGRLAAADRPRRRRLHGEGGADWHHRRERPRRPLAAEAAARRGARPRRRAGAGAAEESGPGGRRALSAGLLADRLSVEPTGSCALASTAGDRRASG